MEMQRVSLGAEERRRLKVEAVGGRPYAERVSTSLAVLLLALREGRGDYFAVLDELDFLDGVKRSSKAKSPEPFRHPLLRRFWHKHYSSARHIPRNIGLRWGLDRGGNQALDQALAAIAREHGEDPDMWPRVLAHRLTVEGYEARAGRLTGEWILYAMHEGRNYYLTLGTHKEGKDPEEPLSRLRRHCAAEWPFLFEEVTGNIECGQRGWSTGKSEGT
jgi:hypothetical protein